jgi:hypothetical protein
MLSVYYPVNFSKPEPVFMKLGMYIMTPEPISVAYSHWSLSVYPRIVARQRLGKNFLIVDRQRLSKNVTAATNTHATIEELLDTSFSVRTVSYQGEVGD